MSANAVEVELKDGRRVLFSYGVPVAAFVPGKGRIKTARRYSVTTSKHANAFLGGSNGAVELDDEAFRQLIEPITTARVV